MNLIFISLAPVLAIALFVYYKDKYEKEPLKLILLAFGLGVVSVFPIIVIEDFLSKDAASRFISKYQNAAWDAFVVAGFTEELFKFLAFMLVIWWNKNFNEKFDGIIYAVMISLGFAAFENLLYVSRGGVEVGILRAFTAVPLHAVCGISMGFFLGFAKFAKQPEKLMLIFSALFVAIVIHGLYDFIIMAQDEILLLLFIPYIIVIIYIAFRKMKSHSNTSRFKNTPRAE